MRCFESLRARLDSIARANRARRLDLALDDPWQHTRALLAAAKDQDSPEHARAVAAMEQWPPGRWFELDSARLGAGVGYGAEAAPGGGWSMALGRTEMPTLLLVLAGTHRDGFLRERAATLLAGRSGPLPSAALAVLAADHVPEVQDVARRTLDARRKAADAHVIVPILLAARRRKRKAAAGACERYVEGVSEETLRLLTGSQDIETRRFAFERAPLTVNELVQIAEVDGDIRARLVAARRAISEDSASAEALLSARPATVRALAVTVAAEARVRPRLEHLLLDRSAHLRRAAQARARTLDVDAGALYRNRLPARAAVLGLGETGSEADVDRLVLLLGDEQRPAVRRAAVRALGRLASPELLRTLLPPLLGAHQPSLAREAGRQLRRIGFTLTGARLDRALAGPYLWTRQAAFGIALGRRGWDTPVAALALSGDEHESLREHARAALREWLDRRAAIAGIPTSEQAARLRTSLARAELSPDLARLVRFHAGL